MLVTRKNFDRCLAWFQGRPRLVCDTETTGVNPWKNDRVCGIALATPDLKHVCYFPLRHKNGQNLRRSQIRRLMLLLSTVGLILTGWNIKFDIEMMLPDGLRFPDVTEDVMLACHHVQENDKPFELKRWATKYIDPDAAEAEKEMIALIQARYKETYGKRIGKDQAKGLISELTPRETEPYACDDVRYTERLREQAVDYLKRWKIMRLWRESNQYLLVTTKMEMRGFKLDVPLTKKYSREARRKAARSYKVITDLAGHEINLNSPKQLCKFLGVTSSRAEILDQMHTREAKAILDFRAWDKADGSYYSPFLERMDDEQVLHPNLLLHGTGTARMSSRSPGNMHSIPRYRNEYKVKDVLMPRRGYVLLSADYNQMELRMGVHVAKEENMAKLFLSARKVDIHQLVANQLGFPDNRDLAKTINFMILYGGGAYKLSIKAGIPFEEAAAYLDRYHKQYWHFRHTSRYWANRAKYQGYIRLWSGRIRHFDHPSVYPKDAFNSLVQGGGAEMLRYSILRLDPMLADYGAHMLLQIHDQIIFEVPERKVASFAPIVRREMERFPQFDIPPIVDLKVGPRWGTLEDYDKVAA